MPPFRFAMQPVLDLRRREHEQSRRALARAESDLRVAEHRLSEALIAVERAGIDMTIAMSDATRAIPISWYRSWIARLNRQRGDCEQVVADCSDRCAKVREQWWTTKRRVESIERLREIQEARWRRAAAAEEQKQMDALATMRFAARELLEERTV